MSFQWQCMAMEVIPRETEKEDRHFNKEFLRGTNKSDLDQIKVMINKQKNLKEWIINFKNILVRFKNILVRLNMQNKQKTTNNFCGHQVIQYIHLINIVIVIIKDGQRDYWRFATEIAHRVKKLSIQSLSVRLFWWYLILFICTSIHPSMCVCAHTNAHLHLCIYRCMCTTSITLFDTPAGRDILSPAFLTITGISPSNSPRVVYCKMSKFGPIHFIE